MICFTPDELKHIYNAPLRKRLMEEILKSGYSINELSVDRNKMEEITKRIPILQDKEEIEIFCALYVFAEMYKGETKICFLLKDGVNPEKEYIDSLEKLKVSLKEKDLTDFLLQNSDGFRAYQLKSYRGKTEVNEFFEFLKKKLRHYCNDMGEVNLLITMQSQGDFTGNFFQDIHERLKKINLKSTGHILISYNEDNKFDVTNTVYPTLKTTRIPHENFTQF